MKTSYDNVNDNVFWTKRTHCLLFEDDQRPASLSGGARCCHERAIATGADEHPTGASIPPAGAPSPGDGARRGSGSTVEQHEGGLTVIRLGGKPASVPLDRYGKPLDGARHGCS